MKQVVVNEGKSSSRLFTVQMQVTEGPTRNYMTATDKGGKNELISALKLSRKRGGGLNFEE